MDVMKAVFIRRRTRKMLRLIPVWLCLFCLCFATAVIPVSAEGAADSDRKGVPDSIHLPVVESDLTSSSGLKTSWSCVWFGRYPSEEVVDSSWAAVDPYALQEGDVIRDDRLYTSLTEADWQDDDTVILDEVSYLRVQSEDVTPITRTSTTPMRWRNKSMN